MANPVNNGQNMGNSPQLDDARLGTPRDAHATNIRHLGEQNLIYVVRHAPAVQKGQCYGQIDVEVAPNAEAAAARVTPQLPPFIERIYSSPSLRTATLAQAISLGTGLRVIVDKRLAELNFGTWEGKSWDEIHHTEPEALASWAESPLLRAPPGGETGFELMARLQQFLAEQPCARSLIVSHAGPIRALRSLASLSPTKRQHLDRLTLDFEQAVEPLVIEPIRLSH
jgi:alpha-ribazole phosphatase